MGKIAVLIPAYNEERTISKVVGDFRKVLPEAEIYVYNNNSRDNTGKLAGEAGAHVIFEPRQGKSNVVRTMFREIEADYYIMVDADDTYPASEVSKLLTPLRNGLADMTIGDRLSNGTYTGENKRAFHNMGNHVVRFLVNRLYHGNYKDIMTGYRGFNRLFVKSFPVLSSGFEVETELSIHAMDKRFKLVEVPIIYKDRPEGSFSKLNTFSDGFKVIKIIFRLFKDYKPLLFFNILASLFFILGIISGVFPILDYIRFQYVYKLPLAVLAAGFIILGSLFLIAGLILDTMAHYEKISYEFYLYQLEKKGKN